MRQPTPLPASALDSKYIRSHARLRPMTLLLGALFLACGVFSAQASAADSAKPQNVLFLAVDDLKPVLGCYGDTVAITPSIDKLARRGTVFLNAQCQWPVCGPSRASLMTSLRPEAVGVMNLRTDMRAKDPDVVTLPQHFKNNGYITAGAGKIYDPRCVDSKQTLDVPSWSIPFAKLPHGKIQFGDAKQVVLAPEVDDEDLTDGQIRVSGIELLHQVHETGKPFFLAVGFKKPHLPFIAPKKYWDLYDADQFSLASHQGGIQNASGYSIHDSSEYRGYEGVPKDGEIPADLQRQSLHGYYACVSYIDKQIGLLIDELEALGLSDSTTIVLWGDHGFHLGDHAMWGKHSTLEQAARAPLVICPASGKAVATTTAPVEFTDIYPTLCQIAGLPYPEDLNGRSLLPLVRGASDRVRDGAMTVFKSKGSIGYSYRSERYRYTEWINKTGKTVATELYDYQSDPNETINFADNPEYATMRSQLAKQLRSDSQGCSRLMLSAGS